MRLLLIAPVAWLASVATGFALDQKYVPQHPIHEPTAAERLNAFKPPAPMPKTPTTFEKAEGSITHTFKNGTTVRPDVGLKGGTPTLGVKGTFKNP